MSLFALGAVEIVFLALLASMVVLIGIFGAFVVARVVEPRGMRALLRKLAGRAA
jgi:hypothetical protein